MQWVPCPRDHEYWRMRMCTLVFLPVLHRYLARRAKETIMSNHRCPVCGGYLNSAEDLRRHTETCPPPE